MTPDDLKNYAKQIGFDDLKISDPTPQTWDRFYEWLSSGYHGEMHYLSRRAEERKNPRLLLESTKSVILTAKQYQTIQPAVPSPHNPFQGVISRYAWGDDYHTIVANGLKKIVDYIQIHTRGQHQARWFVDTAPILEKDFAAQSGIGWTGKHTNILSRTLGNWFFLGVILTSLKLDADPPDSNHCGTCTRCIDVCPTQAFVAPYILDARRCISYLTIELKGSIPREFRRAIGRRIYGCDDCLAICPWNRFAQSSHETGFFPRESLMSMDLIQLMEMTEKEFSSCFKNSPIKRIKRRGFLRNVAVALGNAHDLRAVPVLIEALHDSEPLVRGHAAWALGEIGERVGESELHRVREREENGWVNEEIDTVLKNWRC